MFAQSTAILMDRRISLEELFDALSPLEGCQLLPHDKEQTSDWMAGEGSVLVRSGSGSNGAISATVFHKAWPDRMGDAKTDVDLFGAWAMHFFGMGTFPLCLGRAAAYCPCGEKRGHAIREGHAAFVRCNLSYLFGADMDARVYPEDRNVGEELRALAALARCVLGLPGAVAWFHPAGEVLRLRDEVMTDLEAQAAGLLRPSLWVSRRVRTSGRSAVIETVGMSCLGSLPMNRPDHQLVFGPCDASREQLDRFLEQVSGMDSLGRDDVPEAPVLGPSGLWTPATAEADNPPPRPLVRWTLGAGEEEFAAPAELSEAEAQKWSSHLEEHLGESGCVFHELVSDVVHLDIHRFPPRPGRPFHVLVTQGMSALPMTTPEGAEKFRYAELMVALPEEWVLDGEQSADEPWYWPIRMIKFIARLPHVYDTWVGPGHTIPNGDPAEPYAQTTSSCCALIGSPVVLPESIRECALGPDKTVHLYAVYPILLDEMDYKLSNGADELFAKMEARKVSEVIDPGRRSCLKKRFWLI